MTHESPIPYPSDLARFGDNCRCCITCAWNEWRYLGFVKRSSSFEDEADGRRWWCLLRQSALPESGIDAIVCNEYQQAVAGLGDFPEMDGIRRLPDDQLWSVFWEREDRQWPVAKVPSPVPDPLEGLRRA